MDEKEQLKKARERIKTADRVRYACLFPSLFIVLFLFYGAKFWSGAAWFETCRLVLYNVLFFAVLGMLSASVTKIFLAMSYNKLVKKQRTP